MSEPKIQVGEVDAMLGVFACQALLAGETISEVTGTLVRKRTIYTIQVSRTQHLAPDFPGKYLNHSCSPNTFLRVEEGRLYLVALKDIAPGEQVTFDYATTERSIVGRAICRCGTPECRGRLLGFNKMSAKWKERNTPYLLPHLLEPQVPRAPRRPRPDASVSQPSAN